MRTSSVSAGTSLSQIALGATAASNCAISSADCCKPPSRSSRSCCCSAPSRVDSPSARRPCVLPASACRPVCTSPLACSRADDSAALSCCKRCANCFSSAPHGHPRQQQGHQQLRQQSQQQRDQHRQQQTAAQQGKQTDHNDLLGTSANTTRGGCKGLTADSLFGIARNLTFCRT